MILCFDHDAIKENLTADDTPDQPYVSILVSITPDQALEMVATLDSNGPTERATRDPLARAVLEAIQKSGILNG